MEEEESGVIFEEDDETSGIVPRQSRPKGSPFASPSPKAALKSAKLAALHARLGLPKKMPLQTLARTLVDPTADPNPNFNNASMGQLGGAIASYHMSEYLLCKYPRLPISVLYAAAYAYIGPKTMFIIGKEWGVETAAAPGSEVDPGLLQFQKIAPGAPKPNTGALGSTRNDRDNYRRGLSSRVVYDDEFGDLVGKANDENIESLPTEHAYAGFVKALVGAVYLHAGREAAKLFVKQHMLSRQLQVSSLFQFRDPVLELSRLCKRENFEYPTARILSETGRFSRTPVFVVGIYSGSEKLGEGAGAALPEARIRAAVAALKAWYLYSPGNNVPVPSDMEGLDAGSKTWEPVHVDIGEIIH